MYIGKEMFEELTDPVRQREIFKMTVSRVEVETHSYCNRRCEYCPNVVGDRLFPNVQMKSSVFDLLLSNLAEVEFAGNIVLNSYNEPLYDRSIIDRIKETRAALPGAKIQIYTNGDYLSYDYLRELSDAGLDYLHVSIHLKRGEKFTDVYTLNRISEISSRAGLRVKYRALQTGRLIVADYEFDGMHIETRAINFDVLGTDRGGLLDHLSPEKARTQPCSFVFSHFHMGYTGNVVPCCHIRSDRPEHANYVVGNLNEADSIFDIFFSEKAASWRRTLVHSNAKKKPCDTCTAPMLPNTKEALQAFERSYQRYVVKDSAPQTAKA